MKIVAISDVHGKWNKITIPECDILISAGDYSFRGEKHMIEDFHAWLNKQSAKHIISVQGNHEKWVEANFEEAKQIAEKECPRVHFIEEGLVEIEGLQIWCSAMTPYFYNWAYNRARSERMAPYHGPWIKEHWDKIPESVDILVTHGPPYGILDEVKRDEFVTEHVGCEELLKRIQEVKPDLHIFGHIHQNGHKEIHKNGISFYNSAICDERYQPTNGITIINYEKF